MKVSYRRIRPGFGADIPLDFYQENPLLTARKKNSRSESFFRFSIDIPPCSGNLVSFRR